MGATDTKLTEIVILSRIHRPIGHRVTPLTLCAKLTLMHINMTVRAGLRCTRVLVPDVALTTINTGVSTFERVAGLAVVVKIS